MRKILIEMMNGRIVTIETEDGIKGFMDAFIKPDIKYITVKGKNETIIVCKRNVLTCTIKDC